jgi:hypothetical protein
METRSRKRKREEMQAQNPDPDLESMHEISWQGERLPVELWTKIFYYILAPKPQAVSHVFLMNETEALREHPLIAGIIREFLLFRAGVTYADLDEKRATKRYVSGNLLIFTSWKPFLKIRRVWDERSCKWMRRSRCATDLLFFYVRKRVHSEPYHYHYGDDETEIRFYSDSIYISLRCLYSTNDIRSKTGNVRLRKKDIQKIHDANRILPYGLHFCQEGGVLHLRMPNNPRLGDSKFRNIRSYEIAHERADPHSSKMRWRYEVDCTISLNELYIPTWRPYS